MLQDTDKPCCAHVDEGLEAIQVSVHHQEWQAVLSVRCCASVDAKTWMTTQQLTGAGLKKAGGKRMNERVQYHHTN